MGKEGNKPGRCRRKIGKSEGFAPLLVPGD